ncbi:MAG TPA: class I SAM-dependent methyltransferase [Candidatus Avipropionibacterium avicola]|uniref:Class I SAM-dependent methyltransferase n=1 Tax=Candidatus Avipropionibacterium avicola TaxID=2840701 RepID=A0A9D1GW65_9ACTN|nr:class I SAM-dependent methyltransferase [Candidatus Avipropionibacterium avicola]
MAAKERAEKILRFLDGIIAIPLVPAAVLMAFIRRASLHRLPICRAVLRRVGVMPVRNHYYEPWADHDSLSGRLDQPRALPGLDWRDDEQLALLERCTFQSELADLEDPAGTRNGFRFGNGMFEQGDAEMLYNLIRLRKPRRIYEIGSGNSTLVAAKAIAANRADDPDHRCEHVCVEPFENRWLDSIGVRVVRQRVEDLGPDFFADLEQGDLLFIDSSHVIRPRGDVLCEYLEILPTLQPGVLVHVHDIYTPRDYPELWVLGRHRFWNEQYLLEAFLTDSPSWRIVAAMNYLQHAHAEQLQQACPHLRADVETGSFYLERVAAGVSSPEPA